MSARPTPETDKVESLMVWVLNDIEVALEHSRKMERQRDEALEKLAVLEKSIADMSHPNIAELLRKLPAPFSPLPAPCALTP